MKNLFLFILLSMFGLTTNAVVMGDGCQEPVVINQTNRPPGIEYSQPTYLPEVWYDEDAWTLLVQGHNHYTYFNYYILDADGDCQLSGGIGGGTELIDLPALDSGLCTLRLVAPGGDTYEGTFTVH